MYRTVLLTCPWHISISCCLTRMFKPCTTQIYKSEKDTSALEQQQDKQRYDSFIFSKLKFFFCLSPIYAFLSFSVN